MKYKRSPEQFHFIVFDSTPVSPLRSTKINLSKYFDRFIDVFNECQPKLHTHGLGALSNGVLLQHTANHDVRLKCVAW